MKILIIRLLAASTLFCTLSIASLAQPTQSAFPGITPNGTVEGEFDRFENRTKIHLKNMLVAKKPGQELVLGVFGSYTGSPSPPSSVVLTLTSFAVGGFQYRPNQACTLNVIADGERLKYELVNKLQDIYLNTIYLDGAAAAIPYAELRRIARAKSLEMRFEGTEFTLTSEQQQTFHEFLKRFWDDK